MGQVAQAVFALQNGLCRQGGTSVQQLVGNHGSDCGHGWVGVGHGTAVVLGMKPLAGPHCLGHLRHHGQDACRELLVAEVRYAEVFLFGGHWRGRGGGAESIPIINTRMKVMPSQNA